MVSEPAISVNASERLVQLRVDLAVHPREAVFGAAYTFIDRCDVWLDKAPDGRLVVELKARAQDNRPMESLAGEFGNELLAQSTRAMVMAQNGELVQAIVRRAMIGAGASASTGVDLSALEALDLEDEPFDDPLGIAMSWEQKYGKAAPGEPAAGDAKK